MGKPVIGEVVVLPFPQTDLQVGKLSTQKAPKAQSFACFAPLRGRLRLTTWRG
jgi:hypothetical protein